MSHNKRASLKLERHEVTHNREFKPSKYCKPWRPCKRNWCEDCYSNRRFYFTKAGVALASFYSLDQHVVISWPKGMEESAWNVLTRSMDSLSKKTNSRGVKFIRTLALGKKTKSPHVHFLTSKNGATLISRMAIKTGLEGTDVFIEETNNVEGLLGYFYDSNYAYTLRLPEKPKRLRLLSGSRGIAYGPPTKKQWYQLKSLMSGDYSSFTNVNRPRIAKRARDRPLEKKRRRLIEVKHDFASILLRKDPVNSSEHFHPRNSPRKGNA